VGPHHLTSNLFDSIKIYEESFINNEEMNTEDNNFNEEMDLNFILKDLAKDYHIINIYKQSKALFYFYESTINLKKFYESCFANQEIQILIYQRKLIFPSLESINKPKFNILFLKNNVQLIKMFICVPENLDKIEQVLRGGIEYECSIIESSIEQSNLGYQDKSLRLLNHQDIIEEILRLSLFLHNVNIITSI
jgi:hypothetical protein